MKGFFFIFFLVSRVHISLYTRTQNKEAHVIGHFHLTKTSPFSNEPASADSLSMV